MADARLEDRLKAMLVERLFLPMEPSEITDDGDLLEEYDIDSVMIMEAAVGLEEDFGISLADGDFQLSHFTTINNMAEYVRSKQDD